MRLDLRLLRVTALAALVLLVETVFFHLMEILFDYYAATAVISYAVLGIGAGAFAAHRVRLRDDLLFAACTGATAVAILIAAAVTVRYPDVNAIAVSIAACFVAPVLYITVRFQQEAAEKVYLYDMAGAGLGVVVTVALYALLRSESILLLTVTALPVAGLVAARGAPPRPRRVAFATLGPLAAVAAGLLVLQLATDKLNLLLIFDQDAAPYTQRSIFKNLDRSRLIKTYDNLIGRIDVVTSRDGRKAICYNGYGNDHIHPKVHRTHAYYREHGIEWPSGDSRVPYGLAEEPRFYIIGSAARGITETVKKLTPTENITPLEINPAILTIMQRDFYRNSGKAYRGLDPILGNAIAEMKARDARYDVITLINTHSARTIGYPGGPDYLHTAETYDLFFDHLTDEGYLLFEERPFSRDGELGNYRMLRTAWQVLRDRGVSDPSKHFFVWEWMRTQRLAYPTIDLRMDADGRFRHAEGYYRGIVITREPLEGALRERLLGWHHEASHVNRVVYLKDVIELGEVKTFFEGLEAGDLSFLAAEGFDDTLLTNDRPFASMARTETPAVDAMVRRSGVLSGLLGALLVAGTLRTRQRGRAAALAGLNVLIGFGYFFVEILFMQVYLNVFVSPSMALVLVLGLLLISSGVGGALCDRVRAWQATAALFPVLLLGLYGSAALPVGLQKLAGIVTIAAVGMLMGVFFPKGLRLAHAWGLSDKIPHLFALNSVAGSLAVVLALHTGIHHGYSLTLVVAMVAYLAATLLLGVLDPEA